jgi:hypothetical protein
MGGHSLQVISLRFSAMLLTLLLASSTILNAQNFYSYPSTAEYGQIAINQYKVKAHRFRKGRFMRGFLLALVK